MDFNRYVLYLQLYLINYMIAKILFVLFDKLDR